MEKKRPSQLLDHTKTAIRPQRVVIPYEMVYCLLENYQSHKPVATYPLGLYGVGQRRHIVSVLFVVVQPSNRCMITSTNVLINSFSSQSILIDELLLRTMLLGITLVAELDHSQVFGSMLTSASPRRRERQRTATPCAGWTIYKPHFIHVKIIYRHLPAIILVPHSVSLNKNSILNYVHLLKVSTV